MGNYNFAARNVHQLATRMLQTKQLASPPPWYSATSRIPSSEILTRKPTQKRQSRSRKAAKMFKPLKLEQPEDSLRWEFFNDHPWELARPRVVLESDGKDHLRWDWSHPLCRPQVAPKDAESRRILESWDAKQITQASRPINGESVVQRQQWLMHNKGLSEAAAYDKARKEFYITRHMQEVEQRVATEEATFYGAIHGMGALEVGMQLEDAAFEDFRSYAAARISDRRRQLSSSYTSFSEEGEEGQAGASEDV